LWLCWCEQDGDTFSDAQKIRAFDGQEAAERWAEMDDSHSAEYRIIGGDIVKVHVIDKFQAEAGGEAEVYSVSGETVANYLARKVDR
jgi:hypothetical protein